MSALHMPIPLMRINSVRASRSLIRDTKERFNSRSAIDRARFTQYADFCLVSPSDRRYISPSSTKRPGVNGEMLALSRRNIEAADESETCCSRMIWTIVVKPGFRPHKGGGPFCLKTSARCGSRFARCSEALDMSLEVSGPTGEDA